MIITNGIEFRIVVSRAGHSDARTTLIVYSHYTSQSDQKLMIYYMVKIELKKALFLFIKINKRKPNISIFVLFGAIRGRRKEQTKFVTE